MKIKTSELQGKALDYAVAKCEGWGPAYTFGKYVEGFFIKKAEPVTKLERLNYSTNWALTGPIIERERLDTRWLPKQQMWCVYSHQHKTDGFVNGAGFSSDSLQVAAMRCYVASKLGDSVDIPDELISQ